MPSSTETSAEMEPLTKILKSAECVTADALIPLLQEIQTAYGYLPVPVLLEASERTGIPAARIYGVVTFYEQFHLEPRGRHTIRCCRGTACHVRGGRDVIGAVGRILGVKPGGTTGDMRFTFETIACLGTCFLAPVMMVNNDYYGRLRPDTVKEILQRYS